MAQVIQNEGMKGSMDAVAGIMRMVGENERLRQKRNAMTEIVRALDSDDPMAIKNAISAAANYQNQYDAGLSGVLQKLAATQSRPSAPGPEALMETGVPLATATAGVNQRNASAQYARGEGRATNVRDPISRIRNLQESDEILRQRFDGDSAAFAQDKNHQWYMNEIDRLQNMTTQPVQGAGIGAGLDPGMGGGVQAGWLGGPINPNLGGKTQPYDAALPADQQAPIAGQQAPAGAQPTATNPKTGEKLYWDGSKWQPLQ